MGKNKGPFTLVHPEVEVDAVSPVSPSIVKLKQEEETLINASILMVKKKSISIYICIKVQVYTNCFNFKLNFSFVSF